VANFGEWFYDRRSERSETNLGCLKTRFLALFFCSVFEPAEIGPKAYSVGLFNDQKEGQKWSKPKWNF